MTKAIFLKSMLMLLMVTSFSCAKKDPVRALKDKNSNTTTDKTVKQPETLSKSASNDPTVSVKTQETPADQKSQMSKDDLRKSELKTKVDESKSKTVLADTAPILTSPSPEKNKKITGNTPAVPADQKSLMSKDDLRKSELKTKVDESKPKTDEPKPAELNFTEIKVLDPSVLNIINTADMKVLFENYLTLKSRSEKMISKRKYGMLCQFITKEKLEKNDQLKFKDLKKSAVNENGFRTIKLEFASSKKSLDVVCDYQGELSQKYFEENFLDVIDFKNAEDKYKTEIEKQLSYDEIVLKTQSLKIVNTEKLMKAAVNVADQKEKFGIIAGELVEEAKSILDVQLGRAKQACAVIGTKGTIENNKVFKLLGVKPGSEDIENNFATMQIYYGSDVDQSEIAIECSLRRNGINPGIVFETFKGIFEYGVAITDVKK